MSRADLRRDERITACGVVAVALIFAIVLALLSGCRALAAAAPPLLDVTERVLRAELDRAAAERGDAEEVERLQLVLDVVRACREAQAAAERARDEARAEAERAKAAADDAAARASAAAEDAQSATRLAQAHAEAAAAAEKAAQASERAAEATSRAAALEQRLVELVPQALGQGAAVQPAGDPGGAGAGGAP
jgi:hypothetical protein